MSSREFWREGRSEEEKKREGELGECWKSVEGV